MAGVGGVTSRNGDYPAILRRVRECSLLVNVGDVKRVKAYDVVKAVVDTCGEESIEGCVVKSADVYEVTLTDRESLRILLPELMVNDVAYHCESVVSDSVVVSFLNLPLYVSDCQITDKLKSFGVQILGPIKRRKLKDMYKNVECSDGTRFVKVKFPPGVTSLPYSMKFFDGKSFAYYKVIHNNQMKVCNQCLSEDHVFKNCPENVCRKCDHNGHLARDCQAERCEKCSKFGNKCTCTDMSVSDIDSVGEADGCDECHRPSHACSCPFLCSMCGKFDCVCEDNSGQSVVKSDQTDAHDHVTEHHKQLTEALHSMSEPTGNHEGVSAPQQSVPEDVSIIKLDEPIVIVNISEHQSSKAVEAVSAPSGTPLTDQSSETMTADQAPPETPSTDEKIVKALPAAVIIPNDVIEPPTAVSTELSTVETPPVDSPVLPTAVTSLAAETVPGTSASGIASDDTSSETVNKQTHVQTEHERSPDGQQNDNKSTECDMDVEQVSRRRRLVGYEAVCVNASKIRCVRNGEDLD